LSMKELKRVGVGVGLAQMGSGGRMAGQESSGLRCCELSHAVRSFGKWIWGRAGFSRARLIRG